LEAAAVTTPRRS